VAAAAQRRAVVALGAVVVLGAVMRLVWPSDMEYKADERYLFGQATGANPFPWVGEASGVGTSNPGMGIWVYSLMVRAFGLDTPVSLVRGVMVLNVIALGALLVFALRVVPARQREPWLWATALLAVSPLAVLFSRKLWIQCVLPPFVMAALLGWWKRATRAGAFGWGLVGAWLGQIHMSGFFLAAGIVLWTALFDRRSVRWRWWLVGSLLGAATLVPWLGHILSTHSSPTRSLLNTVEPLFWPFWVSYPLGYNLFSSFGSDAWKFLAWPTVDGVSLYLMLIAFALLTAAALAIYADALTLAIWPRRRRAGRPLGGRATDTGLVLRGSFWGYGLLFTLSGFVFYRHYLIVAFALPFVSLAVCALLAPSRGRRLLTVLVVAEAAISVGYLTYIHVRGGVPGGDYGVAYDHQAPKRVR
jgi:hypothetical protein